MLHVRTPPAFFPARVLIAMSVVSLFAFCPYRLFIVHIFAINALSAKAAGVRELQHETRQLNVSLSAREGDVLASDREMEALSQRLNEERLEKEVTVAKAEAEAGELRRALQAATATPSHGLKGGDTDVASTTDRNSARY